MSIYWSIYKNLEKELITLSDNIYFCDTQDSVYSVHISDLLIRAAVEIEAISKELYKASGGNMNLVDKDGKSRDLYFDSDCIQYLDLNWGITKKTVNVVSPNFFFEKPENLSFMPLRNCNKVGEGRWKNAYQAVKHNRVESLSAGNVANLIRAMASLFLLNIYYRNERFDVGTIVNSEPFDCRMGSEVFSVSLAQAEHCTFATDMGDEGIAENEKEKLKSATLIQRYTEDSFRQIHRSFIESDEKIKKLMVESPEVISFLAANPGYRATDWWSLAKAAGGQSLVNRVARDGESISRTHLRAKIEVVVNKGGQIYPSLTSNDID